MTAPSFRRGYVYWVHLDKWRPAVVVSPDYRNERASDVLVIPCSTVLRAAPTHVPLRRGEGGLPDASVAKCEQIQTLHKSDLKPDPLGGSLSAAHVAAIERGVMRAIGLPIPEPASA